MLKKAHSKTSYTLCCTRFLVAETREEAEDEEEDEKGFMETGLREGEREGGKRKQDVYEFVGKSSILEDNQMEDWKMVEKPLFSHCDLKGAAANSHLLATTGTLINRSLSVLVGLGNSSLAARRRKRTTRTRPRLD